MDKFLLTPENVRGYLASCGLAADAASATVRELGGGVSNIVLLIEWPGRLERRWVVKQSLEKLRVKDDWRSDRARIFREAESIQALRPVLGDSVLPEVLHIDRENFFFVMTAAPAGSVPWKESLLAGTCSVRRVARRVGALLARMINASRRDRSFQKKFWDGTVFDQLRVDPYYRTTAARHPDLRDLFQELVGVSLNVETALVHGDYSPKNILVRGEEIFLIDFEVVHWGDPAFDSGFLLNHLFLKTLYQPVFAEIYLEAAAEFWRALTIALDPEGLKDFERMTLRHLGGLMLARIDGKSPVEYIREEAIKERVRRVAKRILLERPATYDEVVGIILGEIRKH